MVYANIWLRRASKHASRHETCPCSRTGPGSDFHHDAMTPLRKVPMLHPPLREKTNPPTPPPPKKKKQKTEVHSFTHIKYRATLFDVLLFLHYIYHQPLKQLKKTSTVRIPKTRRHRESRRCKPPAWCHLYASDFETPRSNSWPQQPPTQQQ